MALTSEPAALSRRCSSRVNNRLASLDCWYADQGRYFRLCQLRSSIEIEPPRCAPEATVTTRSVTWGSSRLVSAKWPRWLVPICNSKPSAVRLSGVLITPALLINTLSSPGQLSAKARTEARSARSSWRTSQSPEMDSAAAAPLARSRTASTTRAPASASSRAVGSPIPLLAPVTMMVRPCCDGRPAEVHSVELMIMKCSVQMGQKWSRTTRPFWEIRVFRDHFWGEGLKLYAARSWIPEFEAFDGGERHADYLGRYVRGPLLQQRRFIDQRLLIV